MTNTNGANMNTNSALAGGPAIVSPLPKAPSSAPSSVPKAPKAKALAKPIGETAGLDAIAVQAEQLARDATDEERMLAGLLFGRPPAQSAIDAALARAMSRATARATMVSAEVDKTAVAAGRANTLAKGTAKRAVGLVGVVALRPVPLALAKAPKAPKVK